MGGELVVRGQLCDGRHGGRVFLTFPSSVVFFYFKLVVVLRRGEGCEKESFLSCGNGRTRGVRGGLGREKVPGRKFGSDNFKIEKKGLP